MIKQYYVIKEYIVFLETKKKILKVIKWKRNKNKKLKCLYFQKNDLL